MKILGTTGLTFRWSGWTYFTGPSEPLASLNPPLNETAAWNLTVKWPSTDQTEQRGFNKLAQHLLVAEALTTDFKKTIPRTMNYAAKRQPIYGHGRNAGFWDAMAHLSQLFEQRRL